MSLLPLPFHCHLLFLTFLLSLHPPPAESCLCHGACGKQVAGGTIMPGLGMVLADERSSGTGATPLPAQPLQLSEVLQEGQDSLSDPLCSQVQAGRVEQRHSTGWLERGHQLYIWREQVPLFLFPDNMWAEPVCWPCLQPSSSPCPAPAGSVLLPGSLSLTLAVSTAPSCTGISRHAAPGNA